MKRLQLAAKLLLRDWKSGELATLAIALLLAVSAVLAISLVTDRLSNALARESAEMIGGDLVINSTRDPGESWLESAEDLGLATARIHSFDSVIFYGDEMQLASVKAVSPRYPLIGALKAKDEKELPAQEIQGVPRPGEAWADARLLDRLNVNLGNDVYFGAMTLKLTKILTYEPDQGSGLFQFSPRLLINEADLESAQVLGPGSRIRYRLLFHGAAQTIRQLKQQIEPQLGVGHTLIEPSNKENRASTALVNATQYIRIATLLTLLLSAVAIALSTRQYTKHHYDVTAMLRCLGAQQRDVVFVYSYQMGLLTLVCIGIGCGVGWLAHLMIFKLLEPLLPMATPSAGLTPWLIACGSALLLMTGFTLPALLRLAGTPPLRVLRREILPLPPSALLVYGAAALSVVLLLWLLFNDLSRMVGIVVLTALVVLVTGFLVYAGLRYILSHLPHPSATTRQTVQLMARSLRNIASHAATSTSQIMAFAITLMLLIVIAQLRTGLLAEWRLQLPEGAPNYFAFNLFEEDLPQFTQLVSAQAELKPLYPVVRGRMVTINGSIQAVTDGGDNNRELNLTWADQLPEDNQLLEGQWPPQGNGVSVEKGYADQLNLHLGDTLSFNVAGDSFESQVTSIRSVVWESFSPNFYLVFPRQQLESLPTTYLTSFYLEDTSSGLLKSLFRAFPAATLIEVDSFIERLQLVLGQVSLCVELMLVFVLLAGFAVLFATLQTTADERRLEGALVRSFGASRQYLKQAYLMEFGLIGLIAGTLAILGAEIATAVIYRYVFDLTFTPNWLLWLLVPALSAIAIAIAGYLGCRQVFSVSPLKLLNE